MRPDNYFIEFARSEIDQSVADRFEKQVVLRPDRLAVKTKLHQLTYRDFNGLANRIARAVRQRSHNNEPVALLLEHDASALVSIFGVLKAGKCFVPLDPSLPKSRLESMLDDAGAELIVTNDQRLSLARELLDTSRGIIDLDRLDASTGTENLGLSISPDSVTCILYTSGITGRPKGVIHTHRNELHNVMHHTNSLYLSWDDRLTLLGSYSTGQGMQDLYCALLNGATLYPWSLKSDGLTGIADWLIGERMTVYHSAATVFRHFVRNLSGEEEFPQLRIVRLGSEQVSWKDVESFRKHFSRDCVFVNALSSSETKTIRQYVLSKDSQITGMVPVGYPVEDMDVLILDESGNELGVGQVGEIAVRSRYLSPGYWQKPDLTAAVYRADPNCGTNRIFRTGEWGRLSTDGCLEHLGRKDAQVKIRGYRVEIYETELALLRHPAVDQVLVISRESIRGDKYLAAYIVLNESSEPTVSELRIFLRERIPEYMIPSAFVFLGVLPLTPNGKVDRSALPEPSMARPSLDVSFVAPKGPIEETLGKMWIEILGIERIGARDNFFDVGGNSLSAMQVVARMEKTFNARIPLKTFFESPTISRSSRNLSANFGPSENLDVLHIVPAARDSSLPLSFAQQRLWFLDQWEPGSAVYNICRAHRLTGRLDVTAMEESLNAVVQRHEILRTTFPAIDGQPTQVIAPVLSLRLVVVDLQKLPVVEREAQSQCLANEEARSPFDLFQGPLLRATLVELTEDEYLFLLIVHQIVCDGWSLQIFFREFWTYYEAYSAKHLTSVPTLPVQYADFSVWQRQWLQGEVLESQLLYWKKQLGTSLPILNLPIDRSRPALQGFRGARRPLVFSEFLTEGLNELSRREGVTLFMTLMAAFQTILYRYTWEEDLVVGFPIANRNWGETAGLIGFFVNTLVLRTDLSGNPTFNAVLSRVRDACLGAYAHQDLPFERLVQELRPERDRSRNPLFQVMFVFQIPESSGVDLQGLRSQPMDVDAGTSKFDLTLSLAEREERLTGFIECSTDLFDRSTIERMMGHFQTLLAGIVANPEQPISTVPLLTEAERDQLLVEWNNTQVDYPNDSSVHELFEAQVERTPEAVAVEFEGKKLSYRELNAWANQLAHYLRRFGVGPETLVGLCVHRSLEMVIALLGILKAGGAYVPLDPSYPRERLRFMLEDAQVSVLLTQATLVEDRGWRREDGDSPSSILDPRLQVVFVDRDWSLIAQQSDKNPDKGATAWNLAYVIYTSGSMGQPKGVQIEHRSVVNCLHSIRHYLELTENEVFLAVTTMSFDIAALEVYLPLMVGAKLVLASREEVLDGKPLVDRITASSVTVMQATPSAWRLLLDAGWRGGEDFKILSGGEVLSRELANQLLTGGASLWNLYGPTETTIWATIAKVEPGESPISIGRPIANTQTYILDSHLQPVPVGVHSELYIGGDGLARGYLNRPELTAERFVLNPFSDPPGACLYRTGDRARFRPGGNIEYLGRLDNQVKIRGYRVEPGEIEAALDQHPAVKDCVVEFREHESDAEKMLVAYCVPNHQPAPSVIELRNFLAEKLPVYMLPRAFVSLETIPRTPNGKIDRNALPLPDGTKPNLTHALTEPRTEIENLVAQVWREVLKLDKIGIYDNFFELGGHSLLAVRVVYRLRDTFQFELPVRDFFEAPTVAESARRIEIFRQNSPISLPPVRVVTREAPILPSIAQEPILILAQSFPGLHQFNIPAAYRLRGPLNVAALKQSLTRLIDRHEALRTFFPMEDGKHHQSILKSLSINLDVIDLHEVPETERAAKATELSREESQRPFDLAHGPLFRVKVFRLSDDDHILVVTLHHVISDGWSMMLFFRDLVELYDSVLHGDQSRLLDLSIQYVDFTLWQRGVLQEGLMDGQLSYWKRQLSEPLTPLKFSSGVLQNDEMSFFTARKRISISGKLFQSIKTLARQERTTPFVVLLTVLKILLSRYLGEEDIRVATLVANRHRNEVENLIGHFVNTVILRTRISENLNFKKLAQLVRETTVSAHSNQDIPFEVLLQTFENETTMRCDLLSPVLFIFQSEPHPIGMTHLTVSVVDDFQSSAAPEVAVTMFDLVLSIKERSEGLTGFLVYKMFVFDETMVDGFIGNFKNLLERIVYDPDVSVSALCSSVEI